MLTTDGGQIEMNATKSQIQRLGICAIFAIGCATLFLLICPSIEATRTESRIERAYMEVCELAELDTGSTSSTNFEIDADPWGQPYRIVESLHGMRVISCGPNQSTPAIGLDGDDIYSDMLSSPSEALQAAKSRQLLFALSLPVIWLFCSIAYLRSGNRNST